MAARISRVGYFARRCVAAAPARQNLHCGGNRRTFSKSVVVRVKDEIEDDEDDGSTKAVADRQRTQLPLRRDGEINPDFAEYLGEEELRVLKSLSDEDMNVLEETTKLGDTAGIDTIDDFEMDEKLKSELKHEMLDAHQNLENLQGRYLRAKPLKRIKREPRIQEGFFNLNEPEDKYGDEEEEGDISSLAHGELEKHREQREYARLAAWEMPMLSKLVKPFRPPETSKPLRFRYTTYLGEQHPAASKIVVEFCPSDMPNLSQVQRDKLIKLCGARYNPSTQLVRLSCDSFPSQAQNKRYLADRINKLLTEARDDRDTFADVPFDFRYHRPQIKHEFPKHWILTEKRKAELEERRERQLAFAKEKQMQGLLVDGMEQIRKNFENARFEPEPVMAGALRQRK